MYCTAHGKMCYVVDLQHATYQTAGHRAQNGGTIMLYSSNRVFFPFSSSSTSQFENMVTCIKGTEQ